MPTTNARFDTIRAELDVVLAGTSLLSRLAAILSAQTLGALGYATKALLDADLAHADGQLALVTNDATTAFNGVYRKSGASGAGSWVASSYDRVTALDAATVKLAGSVSTGTQKAPTFETTVGGNGIVLLTPDGYDRYLIAINASGVLSSTFINSTRPAVLYRTGERPAGLVAFSHWAGTYTDDLATTDAYSAWAGWNKLATETGLLAFDGDSLTLGKSVPDNYVTKVMRSLGGAYSFGDLAVDGQQLPAMTTNAPSTIDPKYSAARAKNIVIVWGGTNDIKLGGVTGATAYSRLQTYCAARRSAGWKVVVLTLLPREAGASGFETERQSFNTSVRTNWATFADALADVGNDATIGPNNADASTTYYQTDRIHLTEAGYRIVAPLVKTALLTLL